MISRETIDEVKNRIDILDVVSDFISLKRSGQNYKALSPFSNEKTASFYVVPSKGIFKDFSSGKGGDAITFVMEHEGMSYVEAIRHLAKKYSVEIKEDLSAQADQATQNFRDGLYIVMNYAKDYYKSMLFDSDEGKSIGLSYFNERGFNHRIIEKFELGYSINQWDHLFKTATRDGYSEEVLEKSGLLIKKDDGKKYDRFRGRVIFPVHNLSGKIVAFGGRILTKEKDQPKYINSPETEIYHKSNVLYGLHFAKNAIRREDFCYLVEGYTDVNSMHQADIDNVVAASGTALTPEQVNLIRRFSENVTVLFDGDAAGIKAALRGIDIVLKAGMNVRVVLLPDGEDPDSYSKRLGSTGFKQYLKDSVRDFLSFKIDLYANEAKNDPIKKAELIEDIARSIAQIPHHLKRELYTQECSKKLEVSFTTLVIEVNKFLIADKVDRKKVEVKTEKLSMHHEVSKSHLFNPQKVLPAFEKEFIKVLINRGFKPSTDQDESTFEHVYDYLLNEGSAVDFLDPVYQDINFHYMETAAKKEIEKIMPDYFVNNILPSSLKNRISDIFVSKYYASPNWQKHNVFIGEEYDNQSERRVSLRWKLTFVMKMLQDNLAKLKRTTIQSDIDTLIDTIMVVDAHKNLYATQLGRVILPGMDIVES